MTYTVGRQRRISKRVQNIQEQEDARFWRKTWPALKSNGWSHDDECGGFYPPEAQKFHAAKRRRLGSDHKLLQRYKRAENIFILKSFSVRSK